MLNVGNDAQLALIEKLCALLVQYMSGSDALGPQFEGMFRTGQLPNLTSSQIIRWVEATHPDWTFHVNRDQGQFVHIRDANGILRIRLDPPDGATLENHAHLYDKDRILLDRNLRPVDRDDPEGHQPYGGPDMTEPRQGGGGRMIRIEFRDGAFQNVAYDAFGNEVGSSYYPSYGLFPFPVPGGAPVSLPVWYPASYLVPVF